jgi:tRNA G46 methylase TrmB
LVRCPSNVDSPRESGDSRPVRSSQAGVHERLVEIVRRHAEAPWQAPLHRPTIETFERVAAWRSGLGEHRALVLDTGCGTGESTRLLAGRHPDALVLGIDQSAARLRRVGAAEGFASEGPVAWVRGELTTAWRLVQEAGWPVSHQYLLFPNPWPKPGQVQRRWHGHPVFPAIVATGGELELRCNWRVYAEEFRLALETLGQAPGAIRGVSPEAPALTPFERKYAASGHGLWQVQCSLTNTSTWA